MKGRPICAMTHPWTGRKAFFLKTEQPGLRMIRLPQAPGGVQEYSGGAHAFFFRPPAMYGIAKQTGIR